VYKLNFKRLSVVLMGIGIMVGSSLLAQSAPLAPAGADECTKELLLSYFPSNYVTETLKKFNVPQDKWDAIVAGLTAKDKDILKIVEEKASKLNPNPFRDRDPAQRQIAVKLFRETLLQVFGEVLQAQGITDEHQVQLMLDDVQQQKARNFRICMEKQKGQVEAPVGHESSAPEASTTTVPQ
jgi:hypothetical protein